MKKVKQKKPAVITGKFIGNTMGFGFVQPLEGDDIFIPPPNINGALHDDEVTCRLIPSKPEPPIVKKKGRRTPKNQPPPPANRQIGEITEVTNRAPLLGTYYSVGQDGYVQPLENKISQDFAVPRRSVNRFGLADGHRVVFIVPKPKGLDSMDKRRVGDKSKPRVHTCQITEILGHMHDPGVDVLSLVYQYNIPHSFPEGVLAQAAEIPDEIPPEELTGRLDLRDELIITIDGEDTKDIDDAISLSMTPEGHWQLGVHIADVSHYVMEGSLLDEEAFLRGNSVYLADRVIPMLPHRLSSGICSLFPGVDRIAVSCLMTVDARGDVVKYEITPSVINSKRRFTYDEVQELLASGESEWHDFFTVADRLRTTLYKKRHARGALDFKLPEAKIRVDEAGHPISIEPRMRTDATNLIEEFMILANETIATHCDVNSIPTIYRAHQAPAPEKLLGLQGMAKSLGLSLPHFAGSKAIQWLLETAEDTPVYHTLAMSALTSMPQAIYTPDDPKHYGLASDCYCHFTSPIRRYADLQVHRMLKNAKTNSSLHEIAAQCSRTEREAEALEREVEQLKKVQFHAGQEGQQFDGIVSGITPWGMYVMLATTTEGLVPSQQLKHLGYVHDKDKNRYVSKRARTVLAMGEPVRVTLASVNEAERKLVFSL